MKEELVYIDINHRKIFIHKHLADKSNCRSILFLNPIFDEKKRVQKFQAETARELCKNGFNVYRFDYYATGDSEGENFEFDFENSLLDIYHLIDLIQCESNQAIILAGIRIGADLSVKACCKKDIKRLILIEPVIDGNRFLTEQRIRKKTFYSINSLSPKDDIVEIDNIKYEDFQGNLLSSDNITFLQSLKTVNTPIDNKYITIIKTQSLVNKKLIEGFKNDLSQKNKTELKVITCQEFWSALEPVDTSTLTQAVIECMK